MTTRTPAPEPTRRRRDAAATRRRILQAAVSRFADSNFDSVTIRDIAADAGVDAALVIRYFGGKEQLFIEAVQPTLDIDEVLGGDLASNLTRHLLSRLDVIGRGVFAMPFAGEADSTTADALRDQLTTKVIEPLAARLAPGEQGSDAEVSLRAELATAAIIGVAFLRSVMHSPALAGTSIDVLTELVTPAVADLLADR